MAASCNCQATTGRDPSGRMPCPERSLQALEKAQNGLGRVGARSDQPGAATRGPRRRPGPRPGADTASPQSKRLGSCRLFVLRSFPHSCLLPGSARSTKFSDRPDGEIVSKHQRWDEEWREVGRRHGWELPPPAPWLLRLRGIRYVRAAVAAVALIRQNHRWSSVDCIPTGYDDWLVYAIARGWC